VQSALIAGEKLCLAKEQIPHGEWLSWLGKSCPELSERNAQRYMRVYRNRDQLKSDTRDGFSLRQALEVLTTPREEAIEPAPEEAPRSEAPEAPAVLTQDDRPKPVPTLEFMKNLFSQLGTIEPWKVRGSEGFVVRNEKIGTPFPLAFPSAQHAWKYWNEKQEGIQRLLNRLQSEAQPEPSKPSTSCLTCQHYAAGLESDYFCHARHLQLATGEDLGGDCRMWKQQVTIEDVLLHEAMQPHASPEVEPVTEEPSSRKERIEGDKYYSPDGLIRALTDQIEITGEALDPCAGDGRMANFLTEETRAYAFMADLKPKYSFDYAEPFDATLRSNWEAIVQEVFEGDIPEWTITNPPFNQAHQILPLSWEFSLVGVAFLLRLSWLEPCGNRAEWMKEHADHLTNVIVFNPRPQFREDTNGGDQVTVAWFVWRKNFSWQKQGLPCPFTFITDWRTP
ncbi:MAG: DUF3102 domain-containing protein, partial [Leptolyngbyaceae cyanobacterium bins.59]|nr:DUF3102 domain-containing protein [Leptolyngbyaceae cyanobacterium bins.59]